MAGGMLDRTWASSAAWSIKLAFNMLMAKAEGLELRDIETSEVGYLSLSLSDIKNLSTGHPASRIF